ncbi:hypothetical protein BT96DRAFT_1008829 [Gymnopus androsaceus JB14]|uniref:Uncharacterized protein n=1 Tax=Gymnopus androsaceus JB14 TaxID=1447944 RepID=A0A6A4GDV0_9AGAR|nr:hypothetical protein BT96DRAFT_1008829 [Gymnopus androsaceus JB14]
MFLRTRKPEFLINNLTLEMFDSISDQIIGWANESEKEKDGRALLRVIHLVFEKAIDDTTRSEMMMASDTPSLAVIFFANIFSTSARRNMSAVGSIWRPLLELLTSAMPRTGELFKLQMFNGAYHARACQEASCECRESPRRGHRGALYASDHFGGRFLDTTKGRAHMDVYFGRMKELIQSQNEGTRLRFMLQLRGRKWESPSDP